MENKDGMQRESNSPCPARSSRSQRRIGIQCCDKMMEGFPFRNPFVTPRRLLQKRMYWPTRRVRPADRSAQRTKVRTTVGADFTDDYGDSEESVPDGSVLSVPTI